MTTTAQYASVPKIGLAQISVANVNRDGTGTVPQVFAGGVNGGRVDKVTVQAAGTTTAGMVRLFETEGAPGVTISSLTNVGTTVTMVTASNHGRTTGDKLTLQDVVPFEFNVKDASITVTSLTSLTFVVAVAPTTLSASVLGSYFTTPAVPVSRLLQEIPVPAITPSATVQAAQGVLTPANTPWLPLSMPPGYSLRAATHNAETFNVIPTGGNF